MHVLLNSSNFKNNEASIINNEAHIIKFWKYRNAIIYEKL